MTIRFRWALVFPYLGLLVVLYLAGVYLGRNLLFLFIFFLLLPLFTWFHAILTAAGFKFIQEFSTTHPIKGENLKYTLILFFRGRIPGADVRIEFTSLGPAFLERLPAIHMYPGPQKRVCHEFTVRCPFRGIYVIGIRRLSITDLLGWVSLELSVWDQTFYVYPRLITLESTTLDATGETVGGSSASGGIIEDYTLFHSLTEYRPHMSTRHIAWKRFASTGIPSLRVYDQSSRPGITIYLDTRRKGPVTYTVMEAEDCSVEIVLALINHFVKRAIPVTLRTGAWGHIHFLPGEDSAVSRFIERTVRLYFEEQGPGSFSPLQLLQMDRAENKIPGGRVFVVTHIFDYQTIEICTDGSMDSNGISAICNLTGMDRENRHKAGVFAQSVHGKQPLIYLVHGAELIKEELS